jgi:D-alanyl-lipoteichoic acid acyltransferase DltB (MBOAT superfamily)
MPIVFSLYWLVFNKNLSLQNGLVLIASYFFYGWWSWKFLGILILSTILNYAYGFWVASPNRKKAKLFLWVSIINNIGILGVFKYYNFFVVQFQLGFELLGIHTNPVLLQIVLPIGISFYTFHGISYIVDIYKGIQKPVRNFVEYAVFVSFFPLLVAGPIERASHLLPQVQKPRFFSNTQAVEGCRLILWGMFKKVVIADSLAGIVDPIFSNYHEQNGVTLIVGAIAFSFQIYGDFSGYSDIALGTAKLLGFELLSNFRFPYFSRDVAEFWRRWHISLTSWFRDYLYIPLGGSKNGKNKAIRNIFIIFLISGFWHGASWNYIAWGFIHACGFLPLFLLNRNRKHVTDVVAQTRKLPNLKELWQMSTTFAFVTFAWVFFRYDDDVHSALGYIKHIGVSIIDYPTQLLMLPVGKMAFVYIIPLVIGDWYLRRDERIISVTKYKSIRILVYYIILIAILMFIKNINSSFIYFQF